MNNIHHKQINHEKISFAIQFVSGDNDILSKLTSDYANIAKTWLFLRPNIAGVNPSYTHFVNTKSSSYDGVTPQNKPFFGEYVGRYLVRPRVNPITLFGRFSQTQNLLGAFTMNAIQTITNTINKFSIFTPIESLVLGFILGLPAACPVIGFLAVMGV